MRISLATALLLTTVSATPSKRSTTLIPKSCFDSKQDLEKYFGYNYPWGNTHNGAARMDKRYATISKPGTLNLTSHRDYQQTNAGKHGEIKINYLSGTVYSKQEFTVPTGGYLEVSARLRVPVIYGAWPAVWLAGADTWPPEVDIAESKGTGKISFNTFNASNIVASADVEYPSPGDFHKFKCRLKDNGRGVVKVTFSMNGDVVATQYGKDFVGKPFWLIIDLQMEGSSGKPGPYTPTTFLIRDLQVKGFDLE